jgi:hypothetical protein
MYFWKLLLLNFYCLSCPLEIEILNGYPFLSYHWQCIFKVNFVTIRCAHIEIFFTVYSKIEFLEMISWTLQAKLIYCLLFKVPKFHLGKAMCVILKNVPHRQVFLWTFHQFVQFSLWFLIVKLLSMKLLSVPFSQSANYFWIPTLIWYSVLFQLCHIPPASLKVKQNDKNKV